MEPWKCNATALALESSYSADLTHITLAACCPTHTYHDHPYSEKIQARHFEMGKIPVSLGRFLVFLVRKRNSGPKELSCYAECWRMSYSITYFLMKSKHHLYPYMVSPAQWPDVHWYVLPTKKVELRIEYSYHFICDEHC